MSHFPFDPFPETPGQVLRYGFEVISVVTRQTVRWLPDAFGRERGAASLRLTACARVLPAGVDQLRLKAVPLPAGIIQAEAVFQMGQSRLGHQLAPKTPRPVAVRRRRHDRS
ncbi:MAG TPA: hypothetical protein VD861_00425 [Pyrinomonadaceae bacterium]|nr:hypothetical protein [Pyrinomonadaceae bacterium]